MAEPDEEKVLERVPGLDYTFQRPELLTRALTHRSYVNESEPGGRHNERLEFLGDAVVDLAIGHCLMEELPGAREGELSKLRAMVVAEASLARAAQSVDLGRLIRLGRGEEQSGGRAKASILADTFEALIGAVFVDGGYQAANRLVRSLLGDLVAAAVAGDLDSDHKTRLQEVSQARLQLVPRYEVTAERGPDHAKRFEVAVYLGEREVARAEGRSKKSAEQRAAEVALSTLDEPESSSG
jgi:ribonuclease-3